MSLNRYQYVERDRLQSEVSQGVLIIEAEKESGTMHTAEFAVRQHKHLACYYHKLLERASGNQYLADFGKAISIRNEEEALAFARELPREERLIIYAEGAPFSNSKIYPLSGSIFLLKIIPKMYYDCYTKRKTKLYLLHKFTV